MREVSKKNAGNSSAGKAAEDHADVPDDILSFSLEMFNSITGASILDTVSDKSIANTSPTPTDETRAETTAAAISRNFFDEADINPQPVRHASAQVTQPDHYTPSTAALLTQSVLAQAEDGLLANCDSLFQDPLTLWSTSNFECGSNTSIGTFANDYFASDADGYHPDEASDVQMPSDTLTFSTSSPGEELSLLGDYLSCLEGPTPPPQAGAKRFFFTSTDKAQQPIGTETITAGEKIPPIPSPTPLAEIYPILGSQPLNVSISTHQTHLDDNDDRKNSSPEMKENGDESDNKNCSMLNDYTNKSKLTVAMQSLRLPYHQIADVPSSFDYENNKENSSPGIKENDDESDNKNCNKLHGYTGKSKPIVVVKPLRLPYHRTVDIPSLPPKTNLQQGSKRGSAQDEQKASKKAKGRVSWNDEEDNLLKEAVEKEIKPANWELLSRKYFSGSRTKGQLYYRWHYHLSPGLNKGEFTEDEDNVIRDSVARGQKFSKIAEALPGRITTQVRDRWTNALQPGLKNGEWSEEESKQKLILLSAALSLAP